MASIQSRNTAASLYKKGYGRHGESLYQCSTHLDAHAEPKSDQRYWNQKLSVSDLSVDQLRVQEETEFPEPPFWNRPLIT